MFSVFFTNVLQLIISNDTETILKLFCIMFLTNAFTSLENPMVRKECMKLVSIGVWRCLDDPGSVLTSNTRKNWAKVIKRIASSGMKEI